MITPDEAVVEAIATVFRRFAELGTGRQVLLSLRGDGLLLPRRPTRTGRVHWAPPTYPAVHDFLTNPVYAGAFVFGRTRTEKRVDASGTVVPRTILLPRQEWSVLIPDHHPGFIDWATFEANSARLRQNWRAPRGFGGGAPREGSALLQGRLRCGKCSRLMQTGYSGTQGNCPRYLCGRAKQLYGGEKGCQSLGGRRLENRVLEEVFAVLEPAALAATAQALTDAERAQAATVRAFELTAERARYEADRARRQYDAIEPENRLVARTLERTLEAKQVAQRQAERDLLAARARRPVRLTEQEQAWLSRAGADVRAVFTAPSTTFRERKQLLRAILAEVVVTVDPATRTAGLRIIWQGGASTELTMPLTKTGGHFRATDEDTVDLVRRLAEHYDDTTIALILSRQRRRTGTGCPSPTAASSRCGYPAASPPTDRAKLSPPTTTMSSWSPSPKPNASSASARSPSTAGFATGSSPANSSPQVRPGESRSTKPSATASYRPAPTAGSGSTRPPPPSGSPVKLCCIRSNAVNWRPSTSTADDAKAYASTYPATRLDCLINPHERYAQCYSVPESPSSTKGSPASIQVPAARVPSRAGVRSGIRVRSKSAKRLVRGNLASWTSRTRRRASRSSHSAVRTSARNALCDRRCLAAAAASDPAWARMVGNCKVVAAAKMAASAAGSASRVTAAVMPTPR